MDFNFHECLVCKKIFAIQEDTSPNTCPFCKGDSEDIDYMGTATIKIVGE